jgi:uncharacterized protein YgbK (DUF1537 family)
MCFGGSPRAPQVQQTIPVPPPSTTEVIDQDAVNQRNRERQRQRAATGRQSTLLTGGSGAGTPTGQQKTLLGS